MPAYTSQSHMEFWNLIDTARWRGLLAREKDDLLEIFRIYIWITMWKLVAVI